MRFQRVGQNEVTEQQTLCMIFSVKGLKKNVSCFLSQSHEGKHSTVYNKGRKCIQRNQLFGVLGLEFSGISSLVPET